MPSDADRPIENRESSGDGWVDVRMNDPDAGEWDIDVVVVDGRVEYADLRIRRELLASFVDCLIDDVDASNARRVLSTVAENHGIDLPSETD